MKIIKFKSIKWSFLLIVGAIVIGSGSGLILRKYLDNIYTFTKIPTQEQKIQQSTISTEVSSQNKNTVTTQKIFNTLIDGTIEAIDNNNNEPSIEVKVNADKILNNPPTQQVVKKIIIKKNTEYILHNLTNNSDSQIKFTDLREGDNVAIWIEEDNKQLFELDHLTAIKIVKFIPITNQ